MRFRIVNIVMDMKGQQLGQTVGHEHDTRLLDAVAVNIPQNLARMELKAVGDNYVELRLTAIRELD